VRQPAYADFTYHNNPQARREIDREGLACIGDMGYLDSDGYLYICDRKSDMVISGGVNIYPAETEGVLAAMPGVADCAVFGIPDPEFGEALAAVIELQPGARVEAASVRAYLKERIAGYKIPKVVEFMENLPREESGKILKRKLRAPYWERAGRQI
jgi:long-chain acyl-CoA synthetase